MGRGPLSVNESVFTVAGTPLVFGPGCSLETGWHLRRAGVTRALVVTDPHLAAIGWQALWVIVLVRAGSRMFRTRVMKSGPAGGKPARRSRLAKAKPAGAWLGR